MTPFDLALTRLLLASAGCLAAGLGVWGVTALCRRFLPSLALQRSTWLLGQCTIAAAFLVVLLPHTGRLRSVPVIEMDAGASVGDAAPAAVTPLAAPSTAAARDPAPRTQAWLVPAARAWLVLYLLGLGYALLRLRRAQRMLDVLAAGASPVALDGLDGLGGPDGRDNHDGRPAPAALEIDAPISPMLLGLFKPRLLLPRHLHGFDPLQRHMIVEHELTHWRRRDLHWMTAGLVLQTLFWFNPVMRMLREHLSWAQELGCDRDVLRGRPPAQRKAYAMALVAQLKWQHRPAGTVLAFGGVSAQTLAARIALIREPAGAARAPWVRAAALTGLGAVFLANLALQPALAWHAGVPAPSQAPQALQALGAMLPAAAMVATAGTDTGPLACTEIVDAASGAPLVREGSCDMRVTPASTFKIAISLMGYDSGVLADEHAPRLAFRKGDADWNPSWRSATDPAAWLRNSVVWYSQRITTRLGAARVQGYVDAFDYGNRDLSGAAGQDDRLALSELSPTLKISADEQIVFLRKLAKRELPVSRHAYDMTARLLQVRTLDNGWTIHGKTGTASLVRPDGSEDRTQYYGWFVGWASKGSRTLVFARLLQAPAQKNVYAGARARDALLRDLEQRLPSL